MLDIVCGAPNVRAGLKVIVALPGAELPGGFTIKKGVISLGSLIASMGIYVFLSKYVSRNSSSV